MHRNLGFAAVASFLVGASSVHCGSGTVSSSNGFTGSGGSGTGTASGGMGGAGGAGNGSGTSNGGSSGTLMLSDASGFDYSLDSFYVNDPPPTTCDGGATAPPPPGGTPMCPDDKNLPGCPCSPVGTTAACWTGLRAQRDHGDCMDGTTTCMTSGETSGVWGPCNGEVLPVPGATSGALACQCFSKGYWNLANTEPCFLMATDGSGNVTTTGYASTQGNPITCPYDATTGAPTVPAAWSTDTLTADCAGTFTLCYTIKAGNGKSPQPTDCVLAQSCVTATYATASQLQTLPPLPGWSTTAAQAACVTQFLDSGGYGQMSVDGQSTECELIDKVFQTVTYCPTSCNGSDAGMCGSCQPGGGGAF